MTTSPAPRCKKNPCHCDGASQKERQGDLPEEFLSVRGLAELLHLSPSSIYMQRHRGDAPGTLGVQVGRRLLWRRSDIDAWFNDQRDGSQ